MPFFSGGQNDGGLFMYGEHFYILYSIKNCTNDGGKKDSFFVNIHNCFLPSVDVRYNQKADRKSAGGEAPRMATSFTFIKEDEKNVRYL